VTVRRKPEKVRKAFASTTTDAAAAAALDCGVAVAVKLRDRYQIPPRSVLTERQRATIRKAFEVDTDGRATVPARVAARVLGISVPSATRRAHKADVVLSRAVQSPRRTTADVLALWNRDPKPTMEELRIAWSVTSRQAVYDILDRAGVERRRFKKGR
jgi:hypothetical protein